MTAPEVLGTAPHAESPTLPRITFDPALLDDPSIPESIDAAMIDGLKRHLQGYSAHRAPTNSLARIEDEVWMDAWDSALSAVQGARVLLRGSELGLFALRAVGHGAVHALAVESSPFNARIAMGIVHKHFLKQWHTVHGSDIQRWSEDERRASFESYADTVDIVSTQSERLADAACDYFVFPAIDHSLLGTGIVKAVRQHRGQGLAADARILPAKATVFAMAIQWAYPATQYQLPPMNQFRWSLYPQALNLSSENWIALTDPVRVGEINFEDFVEGTWDVELPVIKEGTVDAIIYWFNLELGNAQIDNAPGSALKCIKPAVQYTDPIEGVKPGQSLAIRAHVKEDRLYLQTQPAATQLRAQSLPSWYLPMLLDRRRNHAYCASLERAIASRPPELVLDIGAGCGLLSMMAAGARAAQVVGCEVNPDICSAGHEVIGLNRLGENITLINKDCRDLKIPEDLARRADLAVFELFDCSLIGEGVLHFLAHAREHLLTENACYLPMAARIRAMVIEYRLEHIWGIDVNLLNPYRFSPSFINVDASTLPYRRLTEPVDLFAFDFSTATAKADEKALLVPSIAAGTAGAVMFWFDLQLDGTTWISNGPDASDSLHWKQGLQFLPEISVDSNLELPLIASHDGSRLSFQWKQSAIPKEAWSTLPRLDPRMLAAAKELEQQTCGLLQHCTQDTDEYLKVAELAKRFAVEPAAHDLDPVVAQNFAAIFLNN
ncbi:50S ribosomal protein L11 methyltransferase [Pseudomonas batumici]|uniref:BatL n=2 Tax=Pseudomonas TaxID=286 RepID=D4NZE7_PSEFL|nr:50S ribosomal protein L11 methyltransferase [Pseudomonas batumici]ADD82953.1 BatL [Pseudomonas fluorescens]KIH86018.1 BatL, batumin synthesis operon, hypothetical protein [Pseudomonas batumici]